MLLFRQHFQNSNNAPNHLQLFHRVLVQRLVLLLFRVVAGILDKSRYFLQYVEDAYVAEQGLGFLACL